MRRLRHTHPLVAFIAAFLGLGAEACRSRADGPTGPAGDEAEVVGSADCDVSRVECESTPPSCADGKTPSVRNGCYGPCVPIAQCKPGTFECHQGGPALCEIVPPRCPAGQTL